jgi:ornithine carbamoyltransferase
MTIREYFGVLEGKTVAWIGDGNNVCNSLIAGATICGMKVQVATPAGYEPHEDYLKAYGYNVLLTNDPKQAAKGADIVFTDVWASMGQEGEAEARKKLFAPFQVNAELMALTNSSSLVQHCLPAHKGEEITTDVFAAHANEIYDEAENRLHVQKAVMAVTMGGM